jgi:hypothetical protein
MGAAFYDKNPTPEKSGVGYKIDVFHGSTLVAAQRTATH